MKSNIKVMCLKTRLLLSLFIILLFPGAIFSQGLLCWSDRYTPVSGTTDDIATAIAVDANENVYVTGQASGKGIGPITTLKYPSGGGNPIAVHYKGHGEGRGMALTAVGGYIYVAARSTGPKLSKTASNGMDFVVLKYDVNLKLVWEARYTNTAHNNSYDEPVAITVVGSKVFVTGKSSYSGSSSSNWKFDYTTLVYNDEGTLLKAYRYSGNNSGSHEATGLVVVPEGSDYGIYVTGRSAINTGWDYLTLKYLLSSQTTGPVWYHRYNGPVGGDDEALAIAASNNKVYVTGRSQSVKSDTGMDYLTLSYNTSGNGINNPTWFARYNGTANARDAALAIAAADNHVYVTGRSDEQTLNMDIVTLKYTDDMTQVVDPVKGLPHSTIWKYNGPGNSYDEATSISVKGDRIFVSGRSAGIGTGLDYVALMYNDGSNVVLWEGRYHGVTNQNDEANALAIVSTVSGPFNVYLTGRSQGSKTGFDYVTVKYNTGTNCSTNASSHMIAPFIREEVQDLVSFSVYPTSFTHIANVTLNLAESAYFTIDIINTRGAIVNVVAAGNAEAGRDYVFPLNGEKLPNGLYIVRLSTEAEKRSLKVFLSR
ncbi:T9SS type A sorting domain-containing protein [Pontibacter cellulosilyticus]|uniref:T9SS type A sorting domain-containing protein n=1 Tax=Pontibacter cellulosilyticus TaxID=1720253 RepID=A0A923N4P6_9BACT|nr:hypothetical protein [Pontibacter cellulosilyticus]MBC5992119.1 hypothetical protein [Pontibacter cellulosilyticus]